MQRTDYMRPENNIHAFWYDVFTNLGWKPTYIRDDSAFHFLIYASHCIYVSVVGGDSVRYLREASRRFGEKPQGVLLLANKPLLLAQSSFAWAGGTDGFGLMRQANGGWSEAWEECFLATCKVCGKRLPVSLNCSYQCGWCGAHDGHKHLDRASSLLFPDILTPTTRS